MTMLRAYSVVPALFLSALYTTCSGPLGQCRLLSCIMNWTVCEWSPTPPALGTDVFPFGAPDTCEMVLSRGLGIQRRVLLGRAHCSQLELRLHTVIFIPKSQEELATRAQGDQPSSDRLA